MDERMQFLTAKAENFRAFLLGQSPDEDLTARIEGFQSEQLWATLTMVLAPAVLTMGKDGVVNEMMAHLTPTDPVAVKSKLARYVDCFYEVLTH